MLSRFHTWLRKLLILVIIITLTAPSAIFHDGNTSIGQQEVSDLDDDETVLQSNHDLPNNPNNGSCPCPDYSSIVNMTNNGSAISELVVVEGTGTIWTGNYSIDNSWVQSGSNPSGAIWEDISNPLQEVEAVSYHTGNHQAGLTGADLWTKANESYDFFISDGYGYADKWGQYLTIETYHGKNTPQSGMGNNIDTAYLLLEDGEKVFATSVVLFKVGTYGTQSSPTVAPQNGNVEHALGAQDGLYTYMGNGWTKMVLCFGEYEDGSCRNATGSDTYLPPDEYKDPAPVPCPCPDYDSIVNMTRGPNNAPINKFFAIEGTGNSYQYQASIPTWWVDSQAPVSPTNDIFIDVHDSLQLDTSCTDSDSWDESYSGADLLTGANEAYDFYISDGKGEVNPYGQFITIEVSHCATTTLASVGGNIDSAWIQLTDGTEIFPSSVVYYETGDYTHQSQGSVPSSIPGNGSVDHVLGVPDGSFTYMGNNWSKMVLCFAEYADGSCAETTQVDIGPVSPPPINCGEYDSLMEMENTDGGTVESIGIREITGFSYDIIYDNPDYYGPAVLNAQNGHQSINSQNLGYVPSWTAKSNLFTDTDDIAEYWLANSGSVLGYVDENRFTIVDDSGSGLTGGSAYAGPNVLTHGASVGGATWIYDFQTKSGEVYDFYISDAIGNLDENGSYLTIEVYHDDTTPLANVGGNIDSVWVELTDGTRVYAQSTVYFERGTYLNYAGNSVPVQSHGEEALGAPDGISTHMGNGYSKLVVCFGLDEVGEEALLEPPHFMDSVDEKNSQPEYGSLLSGEVGMSNVTDMIIGFSVGAIGAIILLRKKTG